MWYSGQSSKADHDGVEKWTALTFISGAKLGKALFPSTLHMMTH
jgi:hypothetical protein